MLISQSIRKKKTVISVGHLTQIDKLAVGQSVNQDR